MSDSAETLTTPRGEPRWATKPFLRKVTDIVPSVIYVYNQRTQSNEYSNRSLGEALGYSPAEVVALGAEMIPRLCHRDDLPLVIRHFERICALPDGHVATCVYRMQHKAGRWVWLLSHDTVFQRDDEGAVLRHLGVATDITAEKEAEQRARQEHSKAEDLSQELRAFAYATSHDMISPTNTLQLLLGEVLDSHAAALPADARTLIEMAVHTARQMTAVASDTMAYTDLIGQNAERLPVPLDEVLAPLVAERRMAVARENGSLTVQPLPVVLGDRAQLSCYFAALLDNALRFRRETAPPEIVVEAVANVDGRHADITVRDNGIGIAPEDQGAVFTIFKRVAATSQMPGTGMGLAICQRIALNHSTRIQLVSCLGRGAAFSMRLPLP